MSYEPNLWTYASYGLFAGIVCWIILVIADTCHNEDEWKWEENPKAKLCLLIPRTILLAVMLASIIISVTTFSTKIRLAFGIDLTLIFSFSFRFGLVGWASFLRFFLC